jgi:dTDP-4-amino-4,6-dideoxygalactose transaminase
VLRTKLRRLAEWNRAREAATTRYHARLARAVPEAGRPALAPPGQHVWHLYRIECRDPEHRSPARGSLGRPGRGGASWGYRGAEERGVMANPLGVCSESANGMGSLASRRWRRAGPKP